MSHDNSLKKLIYMANQIGKLFGHRDVAGVANHLTKFWDPSMRKKILHHLGEGGEGLDPLVKEAVQTLRADQSDDAGYFGYRFGTPMQHCGVAIDDPRNAGVIDFFKPMEVTRESRESAARAATSLADEYAAQRLIRAPRGKVAADAAARVEKFLRTVGHGRYRPNPPLSQSLDDVADPWFGLGTHPDIIEIMWKLDETLPRWCRWVFWGGPSLVHHETGVVFAISKGTPGLALRLPPQTLQVADPHLANVNVANTGTPWQSFDIGPVGPEWRFVSLQARRPAWCLAAYDFAGEPMS